MATIRVANLLGLDSPRPVARPRSTRGDSAALVDRARDEMLAGRTNAALEALAQALATAKSRREKFDALLLRGQVEAELVSDLNAALETYWTARRTARSGDDTPQVALADLGIGTMYFALGRHNEGLEAVLRVVRSAQRSGNIFLRGCAELAIGEELAPKELDQAIHRVDVAVDLLRASGPTSVLDGALALQRDLHERRRQRALQPPPPAPRRQPSRRRVPPNNVLAYLQQAL